MRKIVLITLIVTFVCSASAYAQAINARDHFYWIYTWGYLDIMVSMLNAVKHFMGTENYSLLLKVSVLLSLFTVFLSLLSDKGFSPLLIFQKVLLVIAIQILVLSSPVTVVVEEVQNGTLGATDKEIVTDVPAVIAFPLATLSKMEKAVRDTLRNSLNYGGLTQGALYLDGFSAITALNMLQSSTDVRPNNPNFTKTFNSYMENCILPDMISGYQDISKISVSKDLWQQFGLNIHAARIGNSYLDPAATGPDGVIKTCVKLYEDLDNAIDIVSGDAQARLKAGLGLSATIQLDQSLGAISSAIMNYQTTGADMIKNSLAINSFNDSYQQIASGMGVDGAGIAYSMAKAQETAKLNSSMQGIMAKKYMPIAKGYLTVIFVAVMPLVLLIAMITGTFRKPFGMIFGLLTALALWNVGDQILDFIIIVRTHALFETSNISSIGYTLESQPFINGAIMDTLTLSLGMYWMIPTLAFSIATMSGYGAASMMGGISGIATAGASSAAAEAAGGNMSFGNVRANAINMNKYDAASTMSVGSVSKMQMDHQQTASMQSKVNTGTENLHKDADKIVHEGSTWIEGPNGQRYELNGTFEQTAAGWKASGTFIDQNGNSWNGSMTGTAKNMAQFQNNARNGDEAVLQALSIDTSNLSRSHERHQDNISTANTINQNNNITEQRTETIETDIFSKTTGKTVQNNGLAYGYNSNSIAQSVQSGHDGGELDRLREKYEVMKEMEASGNPYAAAARADYEKDMTAFSMAAAQGLPVATQFSGTEGYGINNQNSHNTSQGTNVSFGANAGGKGPIFSGSAGAGYSESENISKSNIKNESSAISDAVTYDTTAKDIRSAIEKGFDSGMSSSAIYKNLGYADTYR